MHLKFCLERNKFESSKSAVEKHVQNDEILERPVFKNVQRGNTKKQK